MQTYIVLEDKRKIEQHISFLQDALFHFIKENNFDAVFECEKEISLFIEMQEKEKIKEKILMN